jgi:hypothetical protein
MALSDENLRDFIKLYEEEFEVSLPIEDARFMASTLVHLYGVFSQPLPNEKNPSPGRKVRKPDMI